ncbi:MAG: putative hydro-lyase [Pseudomonadota bacterium]
MQRGESQKQDKERKLDHQAHAYKRLAGLGVHDVRAAIRAGHYVGHTAGLAFGYQQLNLVILPAAWAKDFYDYCQNNPAPCPLVAMGDPGEPLLSSVGQVDVRFDVPQYHVYRHGTLTEVVTSIDHLWDKDMVVFTLGCSFTYERALLAAGFSMRHHEENKTVPMYLTSLPTQAAGPFSGNMVVSMRPIREDRLEQATAITREYPHAHGAPVHKGDPAKIGIKDIDRPNWGDAVTIKPGEVPVFWGCGVTPQNAIQNARPKICITHKPGCMLIADLHEQLSESSHHHSTS